MPRSTTFFRTAPLVILLGLLCATVVPAQSGYDPCATGQAQECSTISFRFGEYDVISSIYVFLSAGSQLPSCQLEVRSIQKRGGLFPSPISLDLLFRTAIAAHNQQEQLPCAGTGQQMPIHAWVSGGQGLNSLFFTLFSLLHLSDRWVYDAECGEQGLVIRLTDFLDELLFD